VFGGGPRLIRSAWWTEEGKTEGSNSLLAVVVAVACAGTFAGAAVYITFVEHPARLESGMATAVAQWRPSYRRATIMQAPLAVVGLVASVVGWLQGQGVVTLLAGLLLGSVVPVTLLFIFPTNRRLLDPSLEASSPQTLALLRIWGRLHSVRSVLSSVAFVLLVLRLAGYL
jgi:uncharacterized membrane protein